MRSRRHILFGLAFCVVVLVASLVAPKLKGEGDASRYHQHRDASVKVDDRAGAACEVDGSNGTPASQDALSTHLPLVRIDTGGVEIPGKTWYDDDGARHQSVAADGGDSITSAMDIVDHETTYNHADDAPTMQSDIAIHVRGRSSRLFDKSSYALRLVREDGANNPQSVMGMDAHHEWVLHGPYLDKTLMRNYMWYNIGGEIMGYAPNVRFCEVLINGEYQGVYVMLESLTAGEDGARLPLAVSAKNNTFSGYLLQYNGGWETGRAMTNQFSYYARRVEGRMEIVYPGKANITPEIERAISQDFSDFEKALYSYDYDTADHGYERYVDVQSFVDYFLINELTCNYDAGRYSTYFGKDPAGTFHMYLWDMNSCCDNYQDGPFGPDGFQLQDAPWFEMMVRDEDFTDALVRRYWELRKTYFDPDYLCSYIDDTAAYLGEAVERNTARWAASYEVGEPLLTPASRELGSFEEATAQMKGLLRARIAWMDENIETLRQYSAESKVKKYNENAN